jgi:hypothetical protein
MTVDITWPDGKSETIEVKYGEVLNFPLATDKTAHVTVNPTHRFDVGMGKGKIVEKEIHGGIAGLVLDGRGRPLAFDKNPIENAQVRRNDYTAMNLPLE